MDKEKIVQGLECLESEKDVLCKGCAYQKHDGLTCRKALAKDALALIRELIEENERLQAEKETFEIIEKDLRFRNKELQKANEGLAKNFEDLEDQLQSACQIKVSTVRQMQERLKREFLTGNIIMDKSISEILDLVAEEMLKGE